MSDTPVIYENPKYPLPEWARWVAKDSRGSVFCFEREPDWSIEENRAHEKGYSIPGPWQDSLRRIVRLTDPAYYVPENPYTDDEGFLPHGGGEMPEWVRGKAVFAIDRNGLFCRDICNWRQIDSYRIVGEQKEDLTEGQKETLDSFLADYPAEEPDKCCGRPEQCWEPCGDLGKSEEHARVVTENGDDPEQFTAGNPVPFVEKPRSPSDATYPREAVQRAYEHGLRDGRASRDERYAASLDPSCKPRSPSDASDEQYRRNPHLPSQEAPQKTVPLWYATYRGGFGMNEIPGLRALHRWITDDCRQGKGDEGAIREVVEDVDRQLRQSLIGWPEGEGTRVHVVITVEQEDSE